MIVKPAQDSTMTREEILSLSINELIALEKSWEDSVKHLDSGLVELKTDNGQRKSTIIMSEKAFRELCLKTLENVTTT